MCQFCEVAGVGAGGLPQFAAAPASGSGWAPATAGTSKATRGESASPMPEGVGAKGRKTLIKGGTILSMDERIGNHAVGDVLIDGSTIAEVASSIQAPDAAVIDASGHIVMPGFIDAHHHQFETALRSFLADGILIDDGRPESAHNYYGSILQKLSMVYRPQDVYINEVFGGLSQIDAGVTCSDGHQPDPPLAGTFRRSD